MKRASFFPSDRRSLKLMLVALLLVVVFALGSLAIYQRLQNERLSAKRDEALRLLASVEANTTRLFDYADSYLRAIRAYHQDYGSGEKWQHFVHEIAAPHADLFSGVVTIVDREGWVVYQSETSQEKLRAYGKMSDLDHFQYFLKHPGDSVFVGATRAGRMTGKLQYRIARPLLKNGAFDGFIALTLIPEQLTDVYRSLKLGQHSTLTMMTLEPKLIARQPPAPAEMYGQRITRLKESYGIDLENQREGVALGIGSPFERNSRRDIYFRTLDDYPVVVMVGIDTRDLDAEMLDTRYSLSWLALLFTLSVLTVLVLLLRQQRQNQWLAAALKSREAAEQELRIAATAFESQEGMLITDAHGVIIRVNQAFTETTGYAPEDILGQTPRVLKSGRHSASFYKEMWASLKTNGSWQGEVWDRRKNGEEYPKWLTISAVKDDNDQVTNYVGTHFDISERIKAEEKIQELAFFDQLTGLPNRTLLLDRLKQAISESVRSHRHGALLFIDLDHFKTLNDSFGHDRGDLLLQEVAKRLQASLREGDTAARLGGDEFVVMLKDLSDHLDEAVAQAEFVGAKVSAALSEVYWLDKLEFHSTASIGITLFGEGRESREDLLKQADLAMYQAKTAGRNAFRFFDPEMQAWVTARASLENDLRKAVRETQFLLYYQPQVDADGQCIGAEALVRWQHPLRGLVFPDEFISLAEESGLILPIGQWVLEAACRQLAIWAGQPDKAPLTLAVNVSGTQLRQKDFVAQVAACLERTGADPGKLQLELTESHLLTEIEDSIGKMRALRDMGIGFALDDFGTGYSSLSYLKRLPLEKLKIDRSFVRDVLTDPNDAAIAKTIVALAGTLGLKVIAEGVETLEQRDFLANNACFCYQGFLYSPPLPLEEFEAYLPTLGR